MKRRCAAFAFGWLLSAATPLPAQTSSALSVARRYAGAEFRIGTALVDRSATVPSGDDASLNAAQVATLDSFAVIRVLPPVDHGQGVLIAVARYTVVPLGGFHAPNLMRMSSLLGPAKDSVEVLHRAMILAVLADDNGAEEYAFDMPIAQRDTHAVFLLREWHRRRPDNWPDIRVVARSGGWWVAGLTVLSRENHSFDLLWDPVTYGFAFDSDGNLIGWSMRSGTPFATPRLSTQQQPRLWWPGSPR